jgi:hypothetical protein
VTKGPKGWQAEMKTCRRSKPESLAEGDFH